MPEPAFTASEPRRGHAGTAFTFVRNGVGKAPRGNERAGGEPLGHFFRLADSQLRARAVSSGKGRADQVGARRRGFGAQWRHRRFYQGVLAVAASGLTPQTSERLEAKS